MNSQPNSLDQSPDSYVYFLLDWKSICVRMFWLHQYFSFKRPLLKGFTYLISHSECFFREVSLYRFFLSNIRRRRTKIFLFQTNVEVLLKKSHLWKIFSSMTKKCHNVLMILLEINNLRMCGWFLRKSEYKFGICDQDL